MIRPYDEKENSSIKLINQRTEIIEQMTKRSTKLIIKHTLHISSLQAMPLE